MKASDVLAAMQVPAEIAAGFIRVSFGPSTTKADIERFVSEWRKIRVRSRAEAA
jgi:cysteine desulfurase